MDELYKTRLEAEKLLKRNIGYDFKKCATRMGKTYHDLDVVAAILHHKGELGEIAKSLGRGRQAMRNHIYSNPGLLEIFAEVTECILDKVEQCVYDLAVSGDLAAGRFVLSTKGKNRGWGNGDTMADQQAVPISGFRVKVVNGDSHVN